MKTRILPSSSSSSVEDCSCDPLLSGSSDLLPAFTCCLVFRLISVLSSMLAPASSASSASLEQELDVCAAVMHDTCGLNADTVGMVTGTADEL